MNELVEKLNHYMLPSTVFTIAGIPITDSVITMWVIMAFLTVLAFVLGRKLEMVPSKTQNFGEILVDSINGLTRDAIGHHWRGFAPYIGAVILFLGLANTIDIFNVIPTGKEIGAFFGITALNSWPDYHLRPPAKDINVAASFAILSILLVIGASIKYRKPIGFVKSLFEPIPWLFPFKVLEFFIKPLSLCLRLFGNILAAFTIMELIYLTVKMLISYILPAFVPAFFSLYFDIFDGLLQAYIFSFLTALYIGEAIEEEEHEHS